MGKLDLCNFKKTLSLFPVLVAIIVSAAMTANAGVVFNTLPANDQANLNAPCGQTWLTGTLGRESALTSIEVATRSSGANGGNVYLAVYENNASSGNAGSWIIGNFVGRSVNSQNMSVNGAIRTFAFSGATLSDNTRYLYTFVDASLNPVSVGAGVKLNNGTSEQSAYAGGSRAFGGAHTIASRITLEASAAPTISSFRASKAKVNTGSTVTLSWGTVNADAVTLLPGFGDVTGLTTTHVVVTTNTTYSLIASNANASVTNTVDVDVYPPDITVLWRRDWESIASNTQLDDMSFDGGPRANSIEVGTQNFTEISGSMQTFDSANVGGYDLISTSGGGLFQALVEVTDAQYSESGQLTLEFVIGGGSSSNRRGGWYVEFGTVSGTTFTPLPGSSRYDYSATLSSDEQFQDDTNFSELFGYNVGGKLEQLMVGPPASVNGQNVAFRYGIDESDDYAGFSDMMLYEEELILTINHFTATESAVGVGDTITLSWDTWGESSLTLNPGNIDVTGLTSTNLMVSGPTTYSLIASDGVESITNTVDVSTLPPEIVSFDASATYVNPGDTVTFSWSVLRATTLTLYPGAIDVTGLTSTNLVVSGPTVYKLVANDGIQSVSSGVSIGLYEVASIPFTDGFEAGSLSPFWRVGGTGDHRIQVSSENTPNSGEYHATLDSNGGNARNELTLAVDLAGQSNLVLRFWARDFGDEEHEPPSSPFADGADFDGVAISEDGTNWYEVQGLRSEISGIYSRFTIDLDAAVSANGLAYNSTFFIRFNQYDNYGIPTDGIAIDDISLLVPPLEIDSFTASDTVVDAGEAITLSWTVWSSTTLTLNPGNIDVTGLTSTNLVVSGPTTYSLVASDGENSLTKSIDVVLQEYASIPFSEDFETGSLSPYWRTGGTGDYRIEVSSENTPNSGVYHATLDSNEGYARNELTLGVDLAGQSNLVLRFWARDFNDEEHAPVSSPFTGGADFDGVAISEDGINWYEVQGLRSEIDETYSQFTVDLGAAVAANGLSYNSTFRIRFNQYGYGSISQDGIAIDDISIFDPPLKIESFTASKSSVATGGSVTLMWQVLSAKSLTVHPGNIDVTGLTSATFTVTEPVTYKLIASDGITSVTNSIAIETYTPFVRQEFKVLDLHVTGSQVVDHDSLTGDDRGGIAIGTSLVLCTGDNSTARYQNSDLTGGVQLGVIYDALVSDLRSGRIYSLANGLVPLTRQGGGPITTLVLHDPVTGMVTGNTVKLSRPIPLGSETGIFAGYGYMLLHTESRAYAISFDTGEVEDLGIVDAFTHRPTENWAYWGIAEWHNGTHYFVYVKDSRTIARTAAVLGGETTTVSTFSSLGDMGTITAAPDLGRWYFHHEYSSQFGGGSETMGYADATFYIESPDGLQVEPSGALQYSGYEGGPFSQMGEDLSLRSDSASNIVWSVRSANSLVSVSPSEGTLLPGESVALEVSLTNTVIHTLGVYSDVLVFSNAVSGMTQTRNVKFTVRKRPPPRHEFKVLDLHVTGSQVVDHDSLTGDDRGGIAIGTSLVLCTGDNSTARYQNSDLTGGAGLGVVYDALVSDLRSGRMYSLANGLVPLTRYGGGPITTLVQHDPVTGMATSNTVEFSSSIPVGSETGIFAGYGYMLLHTGSRAYSISFETGEVEDLGSVDSFTHRTSENWAYWGIAEWYRGTNYFVYVKDSRTIARTAAVPGGETTTASTFSNLGDMATITAAPELGRWYFHHEGSSQFGGSRETMGYADATFHIGFLDGLQVEPFGSLEYSGYEGGPFEPVEEILALRSDSASNIVWSVRSANSLVSVSPSEGTLLPGESVALEVSLTNAVMHTPGVYSDVLVFSNAVSGMTQTRRLEFTVQERRLDHFVWSMIGSTQLVNAAFNVEVMTVDQTGTLFADYTNSVCFQGLIGGGVTNKSLLQETSYLNVGNISDFVLGFRFTPTNDISVTHVRRISGDKVAIWTDEGTLLAEKAVSGPPGTWTDAPLDSPLELTAGESYRIGAYLSTSSVYYVENIDAHAVFPDGTIDFGCYINGFQAPRIDAMGLIFPVDMNYTVGVLQSVAISPTNTGNFVNGVWSGSVTVAESTTNMFLRADDGAGHIGDSNPFSVGYIGALSVTLPDGLREGDLFDAVGTVEVDVPSTIPLVVNLAADDLSELVVPGSITLPAGSGRIDFPLYVQDDALLDGSRAVNVSASASGYLSSAVSMIIHDNEAAILALTLPQTASETEGVIHGELTVNQAPDEDVLVELISNNPKKIGSSSVVVLAGQTSASFTLPVLDNTLIDGVQTATVEARVRNWQSGQASVFILDDETTGIQLNLPSSVYENDGVLTGAGSIVLPGEVLTDVHVLLTCSDASELTLPLFVTVPAGTNSVQFDITVVDDEETDGMQQVSVVAESPGYITASRMVGVADNEIHHLAIEVPADNPAVLDPVGVQISALTVDGRTITDYAGSVNLTASGDGGDVPVDPATVADFSGGTASADVSFGRVANNVTLLADGGAGAQGTSTVFNVMGSIITVTPAEMTNTLVVAGEILTRTMAISNAGNADLTFVVQGADESASVRSNLVVNGDFEDGNVGFTTGYTYTTRINPDSGYYFVGPNSKAWHGGLYERTDHTSAAGNMLMFNGDVRPNTLWEQSVDVEAGQTYDFGAWGVILYTDNAQLGFFVDGESVGTLDIVQGGWSEFSGEWAASESKSVVLSIRNISSGFFEAYAIDDIVFSPSGENIDDGLVAHYPFNGNADDESGNGNDGAVSGATLTADRFGNADSAYTFDGNGDYIETDNSLGTGVTPFTLSAWVRSSVAAYQVFLAKKPSGEWQSGQWQMHLGPSGSAVFAFADTYGNGNTKQIVSGESGYNDGEWHLISATIDSTSARLYIDGNLSSESSNINLVAQFDAPVHIGDRAYSAGRQYFTGDIDDVRIYNRALTESAIAELYNEKEQEPELISWVTATPVTGTVDPGSSQLVEVTFDATGLTAGDYSNAVLSVLCNDVLSPTNEVPVSMLVMATNLNGIVDLDQDGIGDSWERKFFGDPGCEATLDADGDGLNNQGEFIAGTNPTNALSCFAVHAAKAPGDGFVLTWHSVSGRVYSVYWTEEMGEKFQPLETGILYPQNSYMDTAHKTNSAGFYRADVELNLNVPAQP